MAAPNSASLQDLNGKWVMNKSLSDNIEPLLILQGIGWLTRKAILLSTVTLHVRQYVDDSRTTHIDIEQTATGGIKGTTELRTLDGQPREHADHIFGKLKGRSRWLALSELGDGDEDEAFLRRGWEKALVERDEVVESFVEATAEQGWTARQIWGFEEVKGERRYARHVVVRKEKEARRVRLVYDWAGKEAPAATTSAATLPPPTTPLPAPPANTAGIELAVALDMPVIIPLPIPAVIEPDAIDIVPFMGIVVNVGQFVAAGIGTGERVTMSL